MSATSSRVKLLCTTPCLFKCSDLYYHMNLSSLRDSSLQNSLKVQGKFISHTASRCQRRRLEKIEEYIKSPWIRPEDIPLYNNIGIYNFKLDGRDKTEEYNISVMEAYMKGKYEGNLLYLMQHYYPKNREELFEIDNKKVNDLGWKLGVYLDNTKMEGFLNFFYKENNLCSKGCQECNYCNQWAEKTIDIMKNNTESYLNILIKVEEKNLSF